MMALMGPCIGALCRKSTLAGRDPTYVVMPATFLSHLLYHAQLPPFFASSTPDIPFLAHDRRVPYGFIGVPTALWAWELA